MNEDKDRERVIRVALSARTDEEIAKAGELVAQWLAKHPHDTAVRMAAEQLAMMKIWRRKKRQR